MSEEELLVYEQDEVQLLGREGEANFCGKIRMIEKDGSPTIEWCPNFDDSTSDSDWAVISPPSVTFSNQKLTDSVVISNCKKSVAKTSFELSKISFCKIFNNSRNLELLNKNREVVSSFIFNSENANYFFDVLQRYFTVRVQDDDKTVFFLQIKKEGDIDDQLTALNLVDGGKSQKSSKSQSHYHPWSYAPKKVWGFLHNMKTDPYTTTVSTLCKVYDVVLYGSIEEERAGREDEEVAADLLHQISGMDDLEPGFAFITKKGQLADRPTVNRSTPLTLEEFKSFMGSENRLHSIQSLKERIFRGGIHSNLRPELWCYLLDYYKWDCTHQENEERRRMKEQQYFVMKQQWKTISEEQEKNFSGFTERKSIIEKDVNRTDRNHPFYEGEGNSNLETLHDILMTYIMYNFDLGYVQGMSDLLAPILYVIQNEPTAFWCFVGFMNRVYRNFDRDQSGMKQQLQNLTQLLILLHPDFISVLEARDCENLYFCFRWLLVRFKRELNYSDTLRLWEVLWTDIPCKNFHLCVALAILDAQKDEIINNKFGFADILKHINGLSLNINLENVLKNAEAIYKQLEATPSVPNPVREILGLPLVEEKTVARTPQDIKGLPGHAERVVTPSPDEGVLGAVGHAVESALHHLVGPVGPSITKTKEDVDTEKIYEKDSFLSNFS